MNHLLDLNFPYHLITMQNINLFVYPRWFVEDTYLVHDKLIDPFQAYTNWIRLDNTIQIYACWQFFFIQKRMPLHTVKGKTLFQSTINKITSLTAHANVLNVILLPTCELSSFDKLFQKHGNLFLIHDMSLSEEKNCSRTYLSTCYSNNMSGNLVSRLVTRHSVL